MQASSPKAAEAGSTQPIAKANNTAYFRQLLSERNQTPATAEVIGVAIAQTFVRDIAILVLDMCGFSRITQSHGIIQLLAMIHQMEQAVCPVIKGKAGGRSSSKKQTICLRFSARQSNPSMPP